MTHTKQAILKRTIRHSAFAGLIAVASITALPLRPYAQASATEADLSALASSCKDKIIAEIQSPYEVFFANYSAAELLKLGQTFGGMGMNIPRRPSVLLTDYANLYNPVAENIRAFRNGQSTSMTFAVEWSSRGWSGKPVNFVEIYVCRISNNTVKGASSRDSFMFD
ncbi:MAG: hypothetical protein P1V21_17980 [Rhizobiaceae bacterium]|nr:hypothetical protein [Rhizobiaceae bacterium]